MKTKKEYTNKKF